MRILTLVPAVALTFCSLAGPLGTSSSVTELDRRDFSRASKPIMNNLPTVDGGTSTARQGQSDSTPARRKAGDTKVNPLDGLTYIWMPAGTFTMGCAPDDNQCFGDESPAHQATLTQGFWLGETPVTQLAYKRVEKTNPSRFQHPSDLPYGYELMQNLPKTDPSQFHPEQLPVDSVTWNDAQAYCHQVGMRLPTEAEWEYAALLGHSVPFKPPVNAQGFLVTYQVRTYEARSKAPNTLGLYWMLGNVFQWVADRYGLYSPGAATDPQGPASGEDRVLRGGGAWELPFDIRISSRVAFPPSIANDHVGFRCGGNLIPDDHPVF